MVRIRLIIFISTLFSIAIIKANANILELKNGDTLYISYYIAYFGEYGGADEGIIVYRSSDTLRAKYVKYTANRHKYINALNDDIIIKYYQSIKNNFEVVKEEWCLSNLQIDYINELVSELKSYKPKEGISNASEYYAVLSNKDNFVVLDRIGEWNKFFDIHKFFKIQVEIPKRLYFLGIQVKSRTIKYKTK